MSNSNKKIYSFFSSGIISILCLIWAFSATDGCSDRTSRVHDRSPSNQSDSATRYVNQTVHTEPTRSLTLTVDPTSPTHFVTLNIDDIKEFNMFIDKTSPVSSRFANWAANRKWKFDDFSKSDRQETTSAHASKDFETEKGKHICLTGSVASISRSGNKYTAVLIEKNTSLYFNIVALGSTEGVESGYYNFCGFVTGRSLSFTEITGMFNIIENR